ncbi:MAG: hypothetical protein RL348_1636 [Bacteroidota bacterium]|jgi:phage baseplate assembly protein W
MTISDNTIVYGKLPSKKINNNVIAKRESDVGFRYPIPKNPLKGYFSKDTGLSLIKSNLLQLLKTEPGERFMLPNYGCNLKKYLMEPLDEITFSQIRDTVLSSIYTYLSKISVSRLQVYENETSQIMILLNCVLKDEENVNFELNFKL